MHLLRILLCMHCFGQMFAQNSVYIKPIIESGNVISYTDTKYISNSYFESRLWNWRRYGFDIGATVGLSLNERKFNLEIGIQQSSAGSGVQIITNGYKEINPLLTVAIHGGAQYAMSTAGRKIPVRFIMQLIKKPLYNTAFYYRINAIAAAHYYHQYIGEAKILSGLTDTTQYSPTQYIYINIESYVMRKKHFMLLEGGINFELGKRNKEWISLNMTYLKGFKNIMNNRATVTVHDLTSNTKEEYIFNAFGQGTGLAISLTKNVYICRCKKKK